MNFKPGMHGDVPFGPWYKPALITTLFTAVILIFTFAGRAARSLQRLAPGRRRRSSSASFSSCAPAPRGGAVAAATTVVGASGG